MPVSGPSEPSRNTIEASPRPQAVTYLRSLASRVVSACLRWYLAIRVRRYPHLGLLKIGSAYGGWVVPRTLISGGSICYCGGVGEDVSFDLGLIERFGCNVYAFDPTPRAVAFVEALPMADVRLHFMAVGLWSEDARLRFYAPRNPEHVSHSIVNLQASTTYFEAPCRSVSSIMAELEHRSLDLLKLDIEGAEHAVIRATLEAGIRPLVLCTEIDRPVSPGAFWSTFRRVDAAGYRLVAVDRWNFTFVLKHASDSAPARLP
jgi:FkbM family methyltransferase